MCVCVYPRSLASKRQLCWVCASRATPTKMQLLVYLRYILTIARVKVSETEGEEEEERRAESDRVAAREKNCKSERGRERENYCLDSLLESMYEPLALPFLKVASNQSTITIYI